MIFYYESQRPLDRLLKQKNTITKPSNKCLRILVAIFYSFFIPCTQFIYASTMISIENFEASKYYREQQQKQMYMGINMTVNYSIEYFIVYIYVTMALHGLLLGLFFLNYVFYVVFNWKYYFYASIFDLIVFALSVPASLMQIKYAQSLDKELFSGYMKLILTSFIFSQIKIVFSALSEYSQGEEKTFIYLAYNIPKICEQQKKSEVRQHRPNESNHAIN